MTSMRESLEARVADGEFDEQYSEYIMANCGGERIICNGHTLLQAMEDGYLFDEFLDSLENQE